MKHQPKHRASPKRYYFSGSRISETQARQIKSVGGRVDTDNNDDWFWKSYR